MTINISKPEFNLREKLSELDRPVGNHGSQLMRSHDIEESFNLIGAGRKNLMMNADFRINQRNYSDKAFSSGQNGWGFDRWYFHEGTNGSFKISTKTAAPPPETTTYLELEITSTDTSLASGQYSNISQNIEGNVFQPAMFGTRHARPLTLSFWHRHSIAGIYGGVCRDSNSDLNYVWEYRQSSADAWEKAVIPIKAEFNNAWPIGTDASFRLAWSIGNGASHVSSNLLNWFSGTYYHTTTNQVNMYNTNNSKFRLAAVQLEVGNQATPFDYRTYAEELALCQRYYIQYGGPGGGISRFPMMGECTSTGVAQYPLQFPVAMRGGGNVSLTTNGSSTDYQIYSANQSKPASSITLADTFEYGHGDVWGCRVNFNRNSNDLTAGRAAQGYGASTSILGFSREM